MNETPNEKVATTPTPKVTASAVSESKVTDPKVTFDPKIEDKAAPLTQFKLIGNFTVVIGRSIPFTRNIQGDYTIVLGDVKTEDIKAGEVNIGPQAFLDRDITEANAYEPEMMKVTCHTLYGCFMLPRSPTWKKLVEYHGMRNMNRVREWLTDYCLHF